MAPPDSRVTRGTAPQTLTSAPSTTCRHRIPTVRSDAHGLRPTSRGLGAARRRPTVHFQRTTTRRRPRAALATGLALAAIFAGLLPPTSAGATPANAADASRLAREAAQELTIVDEQVHEATITVAAQQDAAEAAAAQAAAAQAALSVFEPQLRAIAQSGYTGKSQSRVAAFLTSNSADELVQQMTTLDMIAHHTTGVVAEVAAAQAV